MFQFFLHTATRVRMIQGSHEFECTPARFHTLEPDYPGLGGAVARFWTPERAFLEGLSVYDGHDCGQYCQKIEHYTQYPEIFADVSLSKTMVCGCDPSDSIEFSASLKDVEGGVLLIDNTWAIRLTHEVEGDVDRLLLSFVQGVCEATYRFHEGLPFGEWRIEEEKFDLVEHGGVLWKVRLLNPVSFLVYR